MWEGRIWGKLSCDLGRVREIGSYDLIGFFKSFFVMFFSLRKVIIIRVINIIYIEEDKYYVI